MALDCQTLPGLPRAARPSGRFAEGNWQNAPYRIYFGLNMRQALEAVTVGAFSFTKSLASAQSRDLTFLPLPPKP